MSALENLIELLQLVRDESMDCEIAENLTEKIEWSSLPKLEEVYCNLFHYWADEDIRGRDSVYKEFQNNELVKLISHLENKEFGKACNISFLSETPKS